MAAVSRPPADRAKALEAWADAVTAGELRTADTRALRAIARLADRRAEIEDELIETVREARRAGRSWSEIGVMLGVSKQAAQRKYGSLI